MPNVRSMFLFELEFDDFLCASIGEEKNGMTLSVMSVFARRNVDPWREAARLSQLPREVATGELSAMIAELPVSAPGRASPRAIAERLIAPLPLHAGSAASPGKTLHGRAALTRRETVRTAVVLLLLLVSIVFAAIGAQPASVAPTPAATSDAIGRVN
jgi:hypothetical protein